MPLSSHSRPGSTLGINIARSDSVFEQYPLRKSASEMPPTDMHIRLSAVLGSPSRILDRLNEICLRLILSSRPRKPRPIKGPNAPFLGSSRPPLIPGRIMLSSRGALPVER